MRRHESEARTRARLVTGPCLAAVFVLGAPGCMSGGAYELTPAELEEFRAAGPIEPELDRDRLAAGLAKAGPYRVVSGDVLSIRGPKALFTDPGDPGTGRPDQGLHIARVNPEGRIQVPLVGAVEAAGLTLRQIESKISGAAHPAILVTEPAIVVRVDEYRTRTVHVVGAVENPGIVQLRSDEMSLYGALSKSGGILKSVELVVGARRIRILRGGKEDRETITLPVKGLNIPDANVALQGGELIEVERFEPNTFTVVGLVQKPGSYAYPPEVTYDLMQALAVAGGVDIVANPPCVTVFRRKANGEILPATFEIDGHGLVQASDLEIKPGDVLVLEHTPVTWTRSLVARILQLQVNFGVNPLR